jgi:sporadic carbohydrate cluster 2OG-Fe(II) oxygenase
MPLPETTPFYPADQEKLGQDFLSEGYIIREVADRPALDAIRAEIVTILANEMGQPVPDDHQAFLDHAHEFISISDLNQIRLAIYRAINAGTWLRPNYFSLGQPYVENLVGNELAMQNRVNLSIQMPDDTTSLLGIHADVFSGETPYQVVQWVPLVDVKDTKSMFFLPQSKSTDALDRIKEFESGGMAALFKAVENDLIWLEIPYGSVAIFSPNCLHGNVLNEETETRWSLNCRFTGLCTP